MSTMDREDLQNNYKFTEKVYTVAHTGRLNGDDLAKLGNDKQLLTSFHKLMTWGVTKDPTAAVIKEIKADWYLPDLTAQNLVFSIQDVNLINIRPETMTQDSHFNAGQLGASIYITYNRMISDIMSNTHTFADDGSPNRFLKLWNHPDATRTNNMPTHSRVMFYNDTNLVSGLMCPRNEDKLATHIDAYHDVDNEFEKTTIHVKVDDNTFREESTIDISKAPCFHHWSHDSSMTIPKDKFVKGVEAYDKMTQETRLATMFNSGIWWDASHLSAAKANILMDIELHFKVRIHKDTGKTTRDNRIEYIL